MISEQRVKTPTVVTYVSAPKDMSEMDTTAGVSSFSVQPICSTSTTCICFNGFLADLKNRPVGSSCDPYFPVLRWTKGQDQNVVHLIVDIWQHTAFCDVIFLEC